MDNYVWLNALFRLLYRFPLGLNPASIEMAGDAISVERAVDPSPLLSQQRSESASLRLGVCCRSDGDSTTPIDLEIEPPFVLFKVCFFYIE